jgi:hypothetical protein
MARPDEGQLHEILIGPGIEPLAFELRSMIDCGRPRQTTQVRQAIEYGD